MISNTEGALLVIAAFLFLKGFSWWYKKQLRIKTVRKIQRLHKGKE